jgi:hypothetical protein
MKNDLDKVIDELIHLSGGERSNFPLPDDSLIKQYEEDIGFSFSEDYKKVLKEIDNIFYGTIELLSVTRDKKDYRELAQALNDARELGIPKDWLPICEDNGSYYCLDSNENVRYWTGDGYSNDSWVDLTSWIKQVWINGN